MRRTIKKIDSSNYIYDIDFKYNGVDFDYHTEYDCESHGCYDDWACRCGTIVDQEVTEINLPSISNSILLKFYGHKTSKGEELFNDIDIYCVERILRLNKIYNKESFEINISGGYYGEEVDSIVLCRNDKLLSDLNSFFSLKKMNEKIEFVLSLEYHKILPELLNLEWSIESINQEQVDFGSEKHKEMVKRDTEIFYRNHTLPLGIVLKKNNRYRLIDGYHRISQSDKEKIQVIVGC